MPADFMEELNKEKQNLLNSENSSGINEQIASSLQNVIDKANASSESYEILERVVNSFNHAGKNLRDNIGEIISTFNALNNSVKTNTSSASSLKKVYSENFFSGTVRGADNLINKLNEIQENISSIKSFGNIFEESVIGGNNLLNTINEIKSSLAEISSFNI
jgi:methyl-accepting chemotaxis protein